MKDSVLLTRLVRLDAVLDEALEMAVPNARAVRAATRIQSRTMGKAQWTERFRLKREQFPAPREKIVASAARSPQGHIAVVPFIKGHAAAKEALMNRGVRGHPFSLAGGFKTNRQPFVGHNEGLRIARRAHQVRPQQIGEGQSWPNDRLHSSHLAPGAQKRGKKPGA